jgi:hypothetical protein
MSPSQASKSCACRALPACLPELGTVLLPGVACCGFIGGCPHCDCVFSSCAISETGKIAFAPPNAPQGTRLSGGDVVGVGWIPQHNRVFFTVNGALQQYVHGVVASEKELKGLCPIIAGWSGLIVTANFGQGEFAYKVRLSECLDWLTLLFGALWASCLVLFLRFVPSPPLMLCIFLLCLLVVVCVHVLAP